MKSEIGLFPHFVKSLGAGKSNNKFTTKWKASANTRKSESLHPHIWSLCSVERNAFYSAQRAQDVFVYNRDSCSPRKCRCPRCAARTTVCLFATDRCTELTRERLSSNFSLLWGFIFCWRQIKLFLNNNCIESRRNFYWNSGIRKPPNKYQKFQITFRVNNFFNLSKSKYYYYRKKFIS